MQQNVQQLTPLNAPQGAQQSAQQSVQLKAQLKLREMILAGELPGGARIAELSIV